jgi:UPF0148 protein
MLSKDLTKKAVEMLLKGATLLAEPCPYCKGVRVMMNGNALCVSCGAEPKTEHVYENSAEIEKQNTIKNIPNSKPVDSLEVFEKKLARLSKELEEESDYEKQQQILKTINSIVEIIKKLES